MGRLHYAKLNVLYGFMGKIVLMLIEFVARAIFIKVLGEELLGINGVFTNVLQVLSLAELGMNNVVSFSFYKPLAEDDKDTITGLINFYHKVYNWIAVAVLVIGLCLMPFINILINTEHEIPYLHIIYLIFLADTVFSYLFVYKVSLIRADQKGYIITKYDMVGNLVRVILQIFFLITTRSLIIYLIIKVLYNVVINLICAKRSEREYPYICNRSLVISNQEKHNITSVIKSGFIYKISAVLLNSTDNILISVIVGTVSVGLLSNYMTIISGIGSIYVIVFGNLTASIGNLVGTENESKNLDIFEKLLLVSSWMAIVFSICFFGLSKEFICLWIGSKYVMSTGVVLSKAVMLFLSCSLQPLFSYREAVGLYKKTKYAMLAAAFINVILSIIFGELWGTAGILVASLVAMLSTYFWYEPVMLYKDCFNSSVCKYFLTRAKDFTALILGLIIIPYIMGVWKADTWILWILKSGIYFLVSNIYCVLVYRWNNHYKELQNMFLSHLPKKLKKD